jgi:hypothetical protein
MYREAKTWFTIELNNSHTSNGIRDKDATVNGMEVSGQLHALVVLAWDKDSLNSLSVSFGGYKHI